MSLLGSAALHAQNAEGTLFLNNTSFTVRIVAGSGRAEVCTLQPHSSGSGRGVFGTAEYFYPEFDVPLTPRFKLQKARPADINFFYQVDDRRNRAVVIINAVPPLDDNAAYIVLVNNGASGGVSVARTAASRMSRLDADGSDTVNSGESGVYRVDPRDSNDMMISSPVNIAFPPVGYRAASRYVFVFDGSDITLVDVRALHKIGLPLSAAVVFDEAIPEAEHDSLREALDGALSANNVPLRAPPDGVADEDGDEVRYEFAVSLAISRQSATFPANWEFFSAAVTVTLHRNDSIVAEAKTTLTEFNEPGVYRALRQFLIDERQFYRRISDNFDPHLR
jgi:hypothetical protein